MAIAYLTGVRNEARFRFDRQGDRHIHLESHQIFPHTTRLKLPHWLLGMNSRVEAGRLHQEDMHQSFQPDGLVPGLVPWLGDCILWRGYTNTTIQNAVATTLWSCGPGIAGRCECRLGESMARSLLAESEQRRLSILPTSLDDI